MIRAVHPGSGCWLSPIPDPGSRGQKGTQYRSRIRNTEKNILFNSKIFNCTSILLTVPVHLNTAFNTTSLIRYRIYFLSSVFDKLIILYIFTYKKHLQFIGSFFYGIKSLKCIFLCTSLKRTYSIMILNLNDDWQSHRNISSAQLILLSCGWLKPVTACSVFTFEGWGGEHGAAMWQYFQLRGKPRAGCLKVHKIENFFGSDLEFCVISLLFMLKY